MIRPKYNNRHLPAPLPVNSESQTGHASSSHAHSGQMPNRAPDASSFEAECHCSLSTFDGWQRFEWMPPAYRTQRDARPCFHLWTSVVILLAVATIASFSVRRGMARQAIERNSDLKRAARSVSLVKHRFEGLQKENTRTTERIERVESAKPDNAMMQLLGDIAAATRQASSIDSSAKVDVQSIEVILPVGQIENPALVNANQPPRIKVDAFATDQGTVDSWLDHLESIPSLRNVRLESSPTLQDRIELQLSATPISPKALP